MHRLKTGVSELDLVLGGGLEPGSLVVFAGPPGVGKTILAQQICFNLSTPEHKAIYYTTLSESHAKIIRHMDQFDFYDADAVGSRVELVHLAEIAQDGGVGLETLVTEVVAASFETGPSVVVIDSAKALRDFTDEDSLRTTLYRLASRVAHTQTVLFFLGEYTLEEMEGSPEFSLADATIQLAYESREPVDRRWLRVVKMRGGQHLQGRQSFRISGEGIEISPRLEELVPGDAEESRARTSMGVPTLDEMMHGGPFQTDSTVVLGPSGCGKTALGISYVAKGLEEGGRCLFISFQESAAQILTKASSFGLDLQPAVDSGQLVIHHVAPGDLDLDRVGAALRAELARGGVCRVLVDSLAEMVFAGRETERFPAYTRVLVGLVRAEGAGLLVTSETSVLGPMAEPAGGLSFLFHNIILLRYVESGSAIHRAVSIIKMRDSNHSKVAKEFEVTDQGVVVTDELIGTQGLLGWSALRVTGA